MIEFIFFFFVRIATAGADGTKFDVNLFRVESIHPCFYKCGLIRNGCRLYTNSAVSFLRTCLIVAGLSQDFIFPLQYFRDTYITKATVLYIYFSIERQTGFLEKFNDFFHILISIIMYTVLLVFLCRWVPTMSRCELPTFLSCCRKDWILFFLRRPSLCTHEIEREKNDSELMAYNFFYLFSDRIDGGTRAKWNIFIAVYL